MERNAIVLDASVIIKWFTKEEKRDSALEIREKYINKQIEIIIPDLILYEISNALRFNPNFSEEDISEAIYSIFNMDMNIITPTQEIINEAIKISYSYKTSVYDAIYIALAKIVDSDFITADNKLYEKTKEISNICLL